MLFKFSLRISSHTVLWHWNQTFSLLHNYPKTFKFWSKKLKRGRKHVCGLSLVFCVLSYFHIYLPHGNMHMGLRQTMLPQDPKYVQCKTPALPLSCSPVQDVLHSRTRVYYCSVAVRAWVGNRLGVVCSGLKAFVNHLWSVQLNAFHLEKQRKLVGVPPRMVLSCSFPF